MRRYNAISVSIVLALFVSGAQVVAQRPENLQVDKLVAWCIVPFDAQQRTPSQRAQMATDLGLKRIAYDWRAKHVSEFEEEILQYKKHGIEFFAFWSWHDAIAPLIEKHRISPQIWTICPRPGDEPEKDRVATAAKRMLPLAKRTKQLGLKLGIYNHGGWSGEPENMIAVCKELRDNHKMSHVGVVYNFHHGHEHIDDFPSHLALMKPYLLCLNLNGMTDAVELRKDPGKKILPIGSGNHENDMIRAVVDSGYDGPIGILDHRNGLDAKLSLQQNLDGLNKLFQ